MTREEVDTLPGAHVLEFGASWCGICQATRPLIDRALVGRTSLRHTWIEDGKGQRLGRTFGVKLWPTLILLRDGVEVARFVRPRDATALSRALDGLDAPLLTRQQAL